MLAALALLDSTATDPCVRRHLRHHPLHVTGNWPADASTGKRFVIGPKGQRLAGPRTTTRQ
jgi:hypothetical protein